MAPIMTTPLSTALSLGMRSLPALTNKATAITTLVLVPVAEIAFLVAIAHTLGLGDGTRVAYAGLVVSALIVTVATAVGGAVRDRSSGVLEEVISRHPFSWQWWVARTVPGVVIAVCTSVLGCIGVWAIEPWHSGELLARAIAAVTTATACGAGFGVLCCALSMGFSEPYALSNILSALLPVTAGVVAPVSAYPSWLAPVVWCLPGTHAVEFMRGGRVWHLGVELGMGAAAALAGMLMVWVAARRVYAGAVSRSVI